MLTFTEYMKRISDLTEKALIHAKEVKFKIVRRELDNMMAYCISAQERIDEIERVLSGGGAPAEDFGL